MDKVDKVEFTKEAEKPAAPAPSQSWGVIGGGAAPGGFTGSGWDNTSGQFGGGKNCVKDASIGIGFGKHGTIGAELNLRSSDAIGFSLGLGAQYYSVSYEEYGYYYSDSYEDSGFAAMGGAKLHFYFTPRTQPSQHNIFLAGYYGEAIGPAFGVAYGYEGHRESGGGWDFSIGLAIAPDAEEYMAEKVGAYEGAIDYTWIPILIKLGFFF